MTKEQFIALGLTEEQATKAAAASQEELKTYIPKHRFDEVNEENKNLKNTSKDMTDQLENLKKSAGDNEALTKQIDTLQTENKAAKEKYEKELQDLKVTNAIKLAIAGKVHDEDLVSGLFDKTKLIFSEDGKITGLDEQIKTLSESKKFLFKQEEGTENKPGFKVGGDGKESESTNTQPTSLHDAVASYFNSK
ncbi:phage scaffolding protein [Clostridium polynesiense]|uniref:phage scaffolding protein n=1 Tax=Clostridium polynesiense TaxID=1325933 RepID=UPI00058C5A20|nr:phage scaffolding protein [Clostridium polynesiense]